MEQSWRSVPATTSRIDPKLLTPSGPDVRLQKILLDVAKKPVPLEWKYPPYKVEITEDKIAAWKQDHRVPLTMKSSIDKSAAPQ
jgi:hypothetical protein